MSALKITEVAVICATTPKEVIPVSAIQGSILQKTVSNVPVSCCGRPNRVDELYSVVGLSLPEDIDECLVDNGGCAERCINVPGSYACTCQDDQIWVPENETCIPRSEWLSVWM